jgi:hypothetical protein
MCTSAETSPRCVRRGLEPRHSMASASVVPGGCVTSALSTARAIDGVRPHVILMEGAEVSPVARCQRHLAHHLDGRARAHENRPRQCGPPRAVSLVRSPLPHKGNHVPRPRNSRSTTRQRAWSFRVISYRASAASPNGRERHLQLRDGAPTWATLPTRSHLRHHPPKGARGWLPHVSALAHQPDGLADHERTSAGHQSPSTRTSTSGRSPGG